MASASSEYGRFMRWLAGIEVEPDVRRIAKIVQGNLDAVDRTVSAGGQRARVLTPLLRRDLAETDDGIALPEDEAAAVPLPWTRLSRLIIGPFRGFRREEHFDLEKPVVLFYGPNGSGKTSLCEAIEFALLGRVEEAEAKRIDALDDYFDNIHEEAHALPRLFAQGDKDVIEVAANEDLFRFAVIEKNRIEGFARLAARSPAQAGALIATLFGLDAFSDLVNNFTANVDRQLNLERPQKMALDLRRAALEASRIQVANNAATLSDFDTRREQLAVDFSPGTTYARLLELIGTNENPGRLQEVVRLLEEQVPPQSGLSSAEVRALRRSLRTKRGALEECRESLQERAAQVSYRGLYRAVQALQANAAPGVCPACETPLDRVTTDPYQRADAGLELLRDIAALEERQETLLRECSQLSDRLKGWVNGASQLQALHAPALTPLVEWAEAENAGPAWTDGVVNHEIWREWLRAVRRLEIKDVGIRQRFARQDELVEERERLEAARTNLAALDGQRSQHINQVAERQAEIDNFDNANAGLIADVAQEEATYQYELRIKLAYSEYYDRIRQYRDGLPEGLLAELSETTREIYNLFNADDHASDILAKLTLPSRGGERIEIAFAGSEDRMRDALNVLSEGHLRCLGLAILLAKNIKLELPILVFDDAVNAIDHDHRAGIRETIFGDPRLNTKQMLITCHSNEFVKDIHNQLGERASKLYVFAPHAGDHQPIVQGGTDRHYLVRAKERLDNGDQRECLASCRQALENLTWRLWKSLCSKSAELGEMPLVLRTPTSRPELRALTEGLAKKIKLGRDRGILTSDAWVQRHEGLQEILEIPERHLAWQYFNKGTHDEPDREDFEVQIVRKIVEALTKISATLAM
jgi:recombinational DNA repair ATPase RecF